MDKSFEPQTFETRGTPIGRPPAASSPVRHRHALHHHAAAAECHRHAAHGPRVPAHAAGRADPLPPHARLRHAVADGHRPRRHRHRDGGRRATSRAGKPDPRRTGPRRLHRTRLAVEAGIGRHHRAADAPHGRLGRLVARALHHGRGPVDGRGRDLRAPVRRRPDLSRPAPGQLGPGAEDRDLRPRSRQRGRRRQAVVDLAIRSPTAAARWWSRPRARKPCSATPR